MSELDNVNNTVTKSDRAWSDFDYSQVDEATANELRRAGDQWHEAGKIIFEQMILRGNIAERIHEQYKGHFTKWCERVAHSSVQTVNNYRAVARHLAQLDPDTAKEYKARALYILARDVMTDEQRAQALAWTQNQNGGKPDGVTRELAVIALPSTPEYIRKAYESRTMTAKQGYTLAIALNRISEVSRDICASLIAIEVQYGEVVDYMRQCAERFAQGDEVRLRDIFDNQFHLCFIEGGTSYEVSLASATAETVERYINYHRWVHLELVRKQQADKERAQYWQGTVKSTKPDTANGLVSLSFQLPDEVIKSGSLDDIEITVNYRVKKRANEL